MRFCWQNVYESLSALAIKIISTLLAARRGLSQTQIQELLNTDRIPFIEALQELHQCNIVERRPKDNGTVIYEIGSLVLDYLSRHHPPDDSIVKMTRQKLQQWREQLDRSAVRGHTYRYDRNAVQVDTGDQAIAATISLAYFKQWRAQDSGAATTSLSKALELTPDWWEVHRVKAHLMEFENRPIYEIERAFEESIRCQDTDINQFHYAVICSE